MYNAKKKLLISEYQGIIKFHKNKILELRTQKRHIGNTISSVIQEMKLKKNDVGLNFAYISKEQDLAECMSNLKIHANIISCCLTKIANLKGVTSNHKGNINKIDFAHFCNFERFLRYSKNYFIENNKKLLIVEIDDKNVFCIDETTKKDKNINLEDNIKNFVFEFK